MGLIDLKTDLKSLKFDDKPYVIKDINDPPQTRYGLGLEVNKRIDDTSRIAQMLVDKPGIKFAANQALLRQVSIESKSNNNLLTKDGLKGALKNAAGSVIDTAKVIGSTLAQVPVNGTGTHFVHGFLPESQTYLGRHGAKLAKRGNNVDVSSNFNSIHEPEKTSTVKTSPEYTPADFSEENTYLSVQQEAAEARESLDTLSQVKANTKLEDFSSNSVIKLDYSAPHINRESRVGLGDLGRKVTVDTSGSLLINYTQDTGKHDKVNMLGVKDTRQDSSSIDSGARDFIQLEFEIITPDSSKFLHFRAFLDSFSDSFSGNWNNTQYVGRADSVYTYTGFERSVELGFKIAAMSRQEMNPIYDKVNVLASATAPSYGSDGQFMRGTLAKVKVGDYLKDVPCIIESVKFTWQQDYPWEIKYQNPEKDNENDVKILPHVLDCSVSLKILHDFVPETNKRSYIG